MRFETTDLSGVLLGQTDAARDDTATLVEALDLTGDPRLPVFVQDNLSLSQRRHTLRGMHYQSPPHAQAKLVRCVQGALRDVVVDIRQGSPTFGQSRAFDLTAENRLRLFVPVGFLHGFLTLVADTVIEYKCSDHYAPECDGSVHWNSLGIDWGDIDPVVSDKDATAVAFANFVTPFSHGIET